MDGEVVILDDAGTSQLPAAPESRPRRAARPEIRHAAVETPGTLYLFDLMALEGFDLRGRCRS